MIRSCTNLQLLCIAGSSGNGLLNFYSIRRNGQEVGLKRIVYFDIRIFFNFQMNSPNILLHIKVVKRYYFQSIYDSYLTHSAYNEGKLL